MAYNVSPVDIGTTIGTNQTSAWNQSVQNIEMYMTFIFAGVILMFLTQMVIIVQMKKADQIEIFDGEGWFS